MGSEDVIDFVNKAIESSTPHVASAVAFFVKIVMWEDTGLTIRVLGCSIGAAMIGNLFSGLTLIFLGAVGVFAGPIFYTKNTEKIDEQLGSLKKQVDGAMASVPASGAAKKTQ